MQVKHHKWEEGAAELSDVIRYDHKSEATRYAVHLHARRAGLLMQIGYS